MIGAKRATLEIVITIIVGLIIAIGSMVVTGCAAKELAPRTAEQKLRSVQRLFTDPNMAPLLRKINNARIDSELKELDCERALNHF